METKKPYRRTQERHFSAHNMFLHAAELALEQAEKKEPGWFNEALIAIAFSAFAVEAFANALGTRVLHDWTDFESSRPMVKLRILADHLSVPYDGTSHPWEDIRWLVRLRNELAHARPQHVVEKRAISEAERIDRAFDAPDSDLEKKITIGNARRAVEAMRSIKASLTLKVDPDRSLGLYSDAWSTTTELLGSSDS